MINLNIILLTFYIVSIIFYCAFFHEKSSLFVISVVWLVFGIIVTGASIWFEIILNEFLAIGLYSFVNLAVAFQNDLKNIHFLIFFGIIVIFYLSKNKDINQTSKM